MERDVLYLCSFLRIFYVIIGLYLFVIMYKSVYLIFIFSSK